MAEEIDAATLVGAEPAAATETPTQEPVDVSLLGVDGTSTDPLADAGKGEGEGAGVPDTYVFNAPEGIEIDDASRERIDAFGETAKELGLSQEQYQKLVEYDIDRSAQANADVQASYDERLQSWKDTNKSDPELRDEKTVTANAVAFIKAFGDKELVSVLSPKSEANPDGLSLFHYTPLLRALNRAGKALGDPSLVTGDEPINQMTPAERMYPTMRKTA